MVALPGERLSKAPGSLSEADLAAAEVFTLDDVGTDGPDDGSAGSPTAAGADGDDATRRRRRRGGRGRGRGRGRAEGETTQVAGSNDATTHEPLIDEDIIEEEELDAAAPKAPRATPFGSVWDSQLGTPTSPPAPRTVAPLNDDEDLDEPEIPEYLIAEQRRGAGLRSGQGGNRGPRGGRAAYQSAIARERYGRGGTGGINRYPDVSGRTAAPREDRSYDRGDRPDRGPRQPQGDRPPAPRRESGEWSEVPPELEAQLRAQLASKPAAAPVPESVVAEAASPATADDTAPAAPKRRTTSRSSTSAKATSASGSTSDGAPKKRTTRKPAATAGGSEGEATATAEAGTAAPKKRTTRKASTGAADGDGPATAAAPKKRTTRKPASA